MVMFIVMPLPIVVVIMTMTIMMGNRRKEWSHAGLNRGPYGYWPYALTS